MELKEIYHKRLRAIIQELIRIGANQLPEGPERKEMIRLLREMESILEERLEQAPC